jgi:hypothetical protein
MNYATYNNITGMAMGQGFVPISGPPSTANSYDAVFGSAGGLLLNWEPFTFGQRKLKVNSAKATQDFQAADAAHEIFQHQIKQPMLTSFISIPSSFKDKAKLVAFSSLSSKWVFLVCCDHYACSGPQKMLRLSCVNI